MSNIFIMDGCYGLELGLDSVEVSSSLELADLLNSLVKSLAEEVRPFSPVYVLMHDIKNKLTYDTTVFLIELGQILEGKR